MNKVKLNLTAQNLVQFNEGEHEGIRDGGDLYILLSREEGNGAIQAPSPIQQPAKEAAPAQAAPVTTQAAPAQEAPATTVAPVNTQRESASWTEESMMKMDTGVLKTELDDLGVDYKSKDGANTNKKMRTLILDFYKGGAVDDTQGAAPAATAPNDAPANSGPIEIPRSEWRNLKEGTTVLAKLDIEGEEGEKLWEAEITEWKKPDGSDTEELFVFFPEDEEEEYMRENDKLFQYQVEA